MIINNSGLNELKKVPLYKVRLQNINNSIETNKDNAELQNEKNFYMNKLEKIERCLSVLSKEQKTVLERVALKQQRQMKEVIAELKTELFLSRSKIYKILREAEESFLLSYGPM